MSIVQFSRRIELLPSICSIHSGYCIVYIGKHTLHTMLICILLHQNLLAVFLYKYPIGYYFVKKTYDDCIGSNIGVHLDPNILFLLGPKFLRMMHILYEERWTQHSISSLLIPTLSWYDQFLTYEPSKDNHIVMLKCTKM